MTGTSTCAACTAALKPGAAFCASCGRSAAPPRPEAPALGPAIGLYLALLLVQVGVLIAVRLDAGALPAELGATIAFAVLVLGFAFASRATLAGVLGRAGFGLRGYALVILASLPIAALVAAYVHGTSVAFGVHMPSELAGLEGRALVWPLLLVVVAPPLIEELAFRGIVLGSLRRTLTAGEALLVSAFAFAMLHLSVPMLLTHLPLGLYFGWLRLRSGSLWPSVVAHACHNAIFVAYVLAR